MKGWNNNNVMVRIVRLYPYALLFKIQDMWMNRKRKGIYIKLSFFFFSFLLFFSFHNGKALYVTMCNFFLLTTPIVGNLLFDMRKVGMWQNHASKGSLYHHWKWKWTKTIYPALPPIINNWINNLKIERSTDLSPDFTFRSSNASIPLQMNTESDTLFPAPCTLQYYVSTHRIYDL